MNISLVLEIETMVNLYNNTLNDLTEKFAPTGTHKICTTKRSDQPWLDEECYRCGVSAENMRHFKSTHNSNDERRWITALKKPRFNCFKTKIIHTG